MANKAKGRSEKKPVEAAGPSAPVAEAPVAVESKPSSRETTRLQRTTETKGLAIRFDGPPGNVEVEIDGRSVSLGEWKEDGKFSLLVLGREYSAAPKLLDVLKRLQALDGNFTVGKVRSIVREGLIEAGIEA